MADIKGFQVTSGTFEIFQIRINGYINGSKTGITRTIKLKKIIAPAEYKISGKTVIAAEDIFKILISYQIE